MLPPFHPDGAAAVERDAFRLAADFEAQVGCAQRRLKKAAGRRPAPTAFLVDVEKTRAFVVARIEIRNRLDAGLHCGITKRFKQFPAHALPLDPQFTADRMDGAGCKEMILVLL